MDLLSLGLDAALIAGIIGLTEVVKMVLPPHLEKYTVLVPALLGLAVSAAVVQPWTFAAWVVKAISYAGVAAYLYKTGKTVWGK